MIADLVGKGGHVRTVPIPNWVTRTVDAWMSAAAITHGRVTFDIERDVAVADREIGYVNANNPDLSAFRARGGKLISAVHRFPAANAMRVTQLPL